MRWSRTLNVVDCHCEGESGKVVVGGMGPVPGDTMFDKKVYLEQNMDQIRKLLLFEPRGAAWHNANIVLPSNNSEADMGFVILESTEYPAMSGSNMVCVATALLETGMLPMKEPVTHLSLESPAGLIKVECDCLDGKVRRVRLTNQPAFVYHLQKPIEVEGLGTVTVDISYGGMTYTMVDAKSLGFALAPSEARELCVLGQKLKTAAAQQLKVSHPINPLIPGITQTEFMGPLERKDGQLFARSVVIVSPGRCDRSPCGTGTSARLALMHLKGEIKPGETFIHESIIGSRFENRVEGVTRVGPYPAVIPSIAGQAWISGLYQIGLDPTDPFPNGYTLSDTWLTAIG
jgi:proline racemase